MTDSKPDYNYVTPEGTGFEWKYQPSEDKMYVRRYAANHQELAEKAQRIRNAGGTKTKADARSVGEIPTECLYMAEVGKSHGGKYKGIISADGETQQKLLAKFIREPDIAIFMFNDNFRIG
jgi:hypothetical protein